MNRQRIAHGALAGFIGGLAGTFALSTCQAAWAGVSGLHRARNRRRARRAGVGRWFSAQGEPRSHDLVSPSPSERAARGILEAVGGTTDAVTVRRAGTVLHYLFGGVTGAMYGAAVEVEPRVKVGAGIPFGAAVWVGADEVAMPLMGMGKPPGESDVEEHAMVLTAHLAYGFTTEMVRRLVLGAMGARRAPLQKRRRLAQIGEKKEFVTHGRIAH